MGGGDEEISTETDQIRSWRSIVTLIVFVITNIIVLFPFHIPIYVPRRVVDGFLHLLSSWRIISPQPLQDRSKRFVALRFPMNFVTAPIIADLFLLAILAIGRKEVHDGTIGANNISPIDIMVFFLSLAYIAISLDASGLIRYLAFRVLKWGGGHGRRLFFYLYTFFFALTTFIGNDPIILSGTAFLAYMTRVSKNIRHPRAWIHAQFAVANIASAILVSSNPTNLVLAGAFNITFIKYTANVIVPTVVTGIVLFPFLLYVVFPHPDMIPKEIEIYELPSHLANKPAVNPNIPYARGAATEEEGELDDSEEGSESGKLISLEEVLNPFLDAKGAAFGAIVMAVTLITLLAINAAFTSKPKDEHPQVFWITLPAAFVQFLWDLAFGWKNRETTRATAAKGKSDIREKAKEREQAMEEERRRQEEEAAATCNSTIKEPSTQEDLVPSSCASESGTEMRERKAAGSATSQEQTPSAGANEEPNEKIIEREDTEQQILAEKAQQQMQNKPTLVSLARERYEWLQETFPTITTVFAHLPFALVPFAFAMFVLVQALVTKGWVPVFAHGWDHWVRKTGTVGAIGGMGFLSVVLCNFAGTNIGTTILLCRVVQAWVKIREEQGAPITDRTFWATIYSMALGVNYGAFSAAFSASLAGLLWRDILARKHIKVHSLEFARVNLPIITISMVVGCVVLIGQIYITRDDNPWNA